MGLRKALLLKPFEVIWTPWVFSTLAHVLFTEDSYVHAYYRYGAVEDGRHGTAIKTVPASCHTQ